jgi:hypothetical protein
MKMQSISVMKKAVYLSTVVAACGIGQLMAITVVPPASRDLKSGAEPRVIPVIWPRNQASEGGAGGGGGGGGGIVIRTNIEKKVIVEGTKGGQAGGGVAGGRVVVAGDGPDGANIERKIIIKAIEPDGSGGGGGVGIGFGGGAGGFGGVGGFGGGGMSPDRTWLGLGTEEAPEVLSSQMDLEPGIGLVVTYVATNSPAAKAGLQKNDVLIELEGQGLAVPAQLRKLVQARKAGDEVKLVYFRGGKKHTATATLEESKGGGISFNFNRGDLDHTMRELQRQLQDGPFREALREKGRELHEALSSLKIDHEKIKDEVQRSLQEAKRAVEKALQESTNARQSLGPANRALRELEHTEVFHDKSPSVVVRSSSNKVMSIVKSDDAGTLVIVSDPDPKLTAHDKEGKLIFDGPIATQEQKDKVPREVWERVEPLLDQLKQTPEDEEKK